MSIGQYEKDGQTLWYAYVNLRSPTKPKVRVQRRVFEIENETAALAEEKKLLACLSKDVAKLELRDATWDEVIDAWEKDKLSYNLGGLAKTTILDYAALLRTWTLPWFEQVASDLNRGDGRELLRHVGEAGKTFTYLRRLKNIINLLYTWGIEEKLIIGVNLSPVQGIDLGKEKETKLPEILTLDEIKSLLHQAKKSNHEWFSVWTLALLTGMRSGELHALPWSNVELVSESDAVSQDSLPPESRYYGLIRVAVSFNSRFKAVGPTKGGYWRTIPVSGELYWFLVDLRKATGTSHHVLPRFWEWDKGLQAAILRKFSVGFGLKSIKFHTLRACFATQLISSGVAPTTVMKICGWKDLKTMQRYIRMAGIDERGATEGLRFLPISDKAAMGRVVNLFEFKAR